MLIVGLLILVAAAVVGTGTAASNTGATHAVPGGFHIFGYAFYGSVGEVFALGVAVGAIGLLGLLMTGEGLRRSVRLRRELAVARREINLHRSRQQTAEKEAEKAAAADRSLFRPSTPAPRAYAPPQTVVSTTKSKETVVADEDDAADEGGKGSTSAWSTVTRWRPSFTGSSADADADKKAAEKAAEKQDA